VKCWGGPSYIRNDISGTAREGDVLREQELTYRIRSCVYEVSRVLGAGFLEKVYERALLKELALQGIQAHSQISLPVTYKDAVVGEYCADIVVEDRIVLELKAKSDLSAADEAQLINYLRASDLSVGLLVNFSYPKATVKRFVV